MVTRDRECIYILFFIMQEMRHNIAGPLCFSGDVIKRDVLLPMVIEALICSHCLVLFIPCGES